MIDSMLRRGCGSHETRQLADRERCARPSIAARTRRRGGSAIGLLALALAALALAADAPARAIEFVVSDIAVSEGGAIDGTQVTIPVGGTVTVGGRVIDPGAESVYGLGASYFGWNPAILAFASGDTVGSLFHALCLEGVGAFNGLTNYVVRPLAETVVSVSGVGGAVAASAPGQPRVRVLQAVSATARTANVADPGLDGVCSGGDAQFRVTFSGLADGETSITIGTGDDLGGRVVPGLTGLTTLATNAVVTVTVPEPGLGSVLAGAMLLVGVRARSRSSLRARRRAGAGSSPAYASGRNRPSHGAPPTPS